MCVRDYFQFFFVLCFVCAFFLQNYVARLDVPFNRRRMIFFFIMGGGGEREKGAIFLSEEKGDYLSSYSFKEKGGTLRSSSSSTEKEKGAFFLSKEKGS